MARVRRINVSQIEGNSSSSSTIRPDGEMALYPNNNNFDFVIHNGTTGTNSNKVFSKGIFYGYNGDSADGAGLNTIKLIPDSTVFGNGSQQYLIVDPTFPNHIHLRAGGTIDNSSAQLYIGGEASYFSVGSGANPSIYVSSNFNTWTFGTTGVFTMPPGGDIHDSSGTSVIATAPLRTVAKTGSSTPGTGNVATITLNPVNNTNFVPGSYPGIYLAIGTGFSFTLDVAANGDLSTTIISSSGGFQVGDSGTLNGAAITGGSTPTDDINVTVATLANVAVATPLDLTKQVQKLTDGYYSLANGVEGQIIYLVPQNGAAYDNVSISVANGRVLNEGIVATVYTNINFYPFGDTLNTAIKNIVTLIFTDGAWQASSGQWD